MAKIATRKVGSISQLRSNLSKGGGWIIQSIPKEDALLVRFLTEPDEWVGYEEVWDPSIRKFYPAPQHLENRDEVNISFRYLGCVVDLSNDRVIALRMPRDLANRLVNRYDKYGTLMDRDYELSRYGEGVQKEAGQVRHLGS